MTEALSLVFSGEIIVVFLLSSIFGLFVGATPGLSATLATALLVPITFFMSAEAAITAIISCAAMAIFAGDIPGALFRIPGTPASAAYTDDTWHLTQKGRVAEALGGSLLASAIGGVVGTLILIQAAPQLASLALNFTSYEYFWLGLLGLSAGILISNVSPLKGLISICLGLMMSTVGLDAASGQQRFTLGLMELQGGFSIVAVLIGVFAISEILRRGETVAEPQPPVPDLRGSVLTGQWRNMWRHRTGLLRGSIMGTVVGILPGAGSDVAAWLSYTSAKRFSKTPELFGKGSLEGVIEAGASNNAALSGAFVPTLVFGIPGDTITAILIGVLMIKGITPGPAVFENSATLVHVLYTVFIAANVMMVPLGLAYIAASKRLLQIDLRLLYALILMFCAFGAFASNNSNFDVWLIAIFGVAVWILDKNGFPAAPLALGLVLGGFIENNFYISAIKAQGSVLPFFQRPVAAVLATIVIAVWAYALFAPAWQSLRRFRHAY